MKPGDPRIQQWAIAAVQSARDKGLSLDWARQDFVDNYSRAQNQYTQYELGYAFDQARAAAERPAAPEPERTALWTPGGAADQKAPAARWRSAASIMEEQFPPLSWLTILGQKGYIMEGMTNLLSAGWRSGKTELMAHCMMEWPDKRVGYLTEEPRRLWHSRLRKLEGAGLMPAGTGKRVEFLALDEDSEENEARFALEQAFSGDHDIIVVDTMRVFFGIEDENDAVKTTAVIRPWVKASRRAHKTLIAVHHNRKSGGEGGAATSGTTGIPMHFDSYVELRQVGGEDAPYRELYSRPREAENRKFIAKWDKDTEDGPSYLRFEREGGWNDHNAAASTQHERVKDAMEDGTARSRREIEERTGLSKDQVKAIVARLLEAEAFVVDTPKRGSKPELVRMAVTLDQPGLVVVGA